MTNNSIGDAIRNSRIKSNITQEVLAEKLSISVTHLKHIESGHRLPSVPVLVNIMTILGMSFDDVVFDTSNTSEKLLNENILLLKQCSKRDLEIINAALHAIKNSK